MSNEQMRQPRSLLQQQTALIQSIERLIMRSLVFIFVATMALCTPSFACGTGREAALFIGVLFILPLAGLLVAQIALVRTTRAALLDRSRPLLALLTAGLATSWIALGLYAGVFLCSRGLLLVGVPVLVIQSMLLAGLLRGAFPGRLRFSV